MSLYIQVVSRCAEGVIFILETVCWSSSDLIVFGLSVKVLDLLYVSAQTSLGFAGSMSSLSFWVLRPQVFGWSLGI